MTETIYVQRVDADRGSAGEQFRVIAKHRQGERWPLVLETDDQFAASLAARAAEQRFPVRVEWRQSAYGRDLVQIERADTPQAVA
jgi:hypothetical protein